MNRKIINKKIIKSYFASSNIEMCRKQANRHCIDTIFVLIHEITSCHVHVSVDWSKISQPQIITVGEIYCHKCHHHSSRTKDVPERYIR